MPTKAFTIPAPRIEATDRRREPGCTQERRPRREQASEMLHQRNASQESQQRPESVSEAPHRERIIGINIRQKTTAEMG